MHAFVYGIKRNTEEPIINMERCDSGIFDKNGLIVGGYGRCLAGSTKHASIKQFSYMSNDVAETLMST